MSKSASTNFWSALKKPLDGAIPLMPGYSEAVKRPLFLVPAGYPSAAQDYMEQELDIHRL